MKPFPTQVKRRIVGLLALTVSSSLAMLLLSPTVSVASESPQQRISGTTLTATSSVWLDDCTEQDTFLVAFTTTDGPSVFYSSTMDNLCAGLYTTTYGQGPAAQLKVAGQLSTGHVVAVLPVTTIVVTTSPFTEESSFGTLNIDETWTANGPLTRESSSESQSIPGVYRLSYSVKSLARPATVAGALGLGSGYFAKSTTTSLTVTHY